MISIDAKLSGDIEGDLDRFAENVRSGVIFAGAAAMAKVMYEEVKTRAPTLGKEHYFYGKNQKYLMPIDALKKSIYRAYAADRSSDYKKTYRISWRKSAGNNVNAAPYGWWVEFGNSRAPAHSFMRPAWDAAHERMMQAGMARMAERLNEAIAGASATRTLPNIITAGPGMAEWSARMSAS